MDDEKTAADKGTEPVIESASATTDPENANSGNAAYVVFAVVAALMLVLVTGLSSCTRALSDVAWANADGSDWAWVGYAPELEVDTWLDELGESRDGGTPLVGASLRAI